MHDVPGREDLAGLGGWRQLCSFLFLLQTKPKPAEPRPLQQARKQSKDSSQQGMTPVNVCFPFSVLDLEV